jgi:hypothetical protein
VTYLATINVPGYLPMDDEPPTFDTAREAWDYLRDERTRGEDDQLESDGDGYSATKNTLDDIADNYCEATRENYGLDFDGTGTVHGDTPGGRIHDLGLSYTVSIAG